MGGNAYATILGGRVSQTACGAAGVRTGYADRPRGAAWKIYPRTARQRGRRMLPYRTETGIAGWDASRDRGTALRSDASRTGKAAVSAASAVVPAAETERARYGDAGAAYAAAWQCKRREQRQRRSGRQSAVEADGKMSGFVCVARRCAKKSASGFSEALFLGMGWEVILGGIVPCSLL